MQYGERQCLHRHNFFGKCVPILQFLHLPFITLAKTTSSERISFVLELDDILVFPSSFSNLIRQHATKHGVLHMMALLYDSDKKLNVIKS